jgi:hypothetical protein
MVPILEGFGAQALMDELSTFSYPHFHEDTPILLSYGFRKMNLCGSSV